MTRSRSLSPRRRPADARGPPYGAKVVHAAAGTSPYAMPPWYVRAWCRWFGHRVVPAGGSARGEAGILGFDACLRCGKMVWSGIVRRGV